MNPEAEQLEIEAYARHLGDVARDSGMSGALWATEDPWKRRALGAIESLVDAGVVFDSHDIRAVAGAPPSPGPLGALIRNVAQSGLIECVGVGTSRDPSRHASIVRRWRARAP